MDPSRWIAALPVRLRSLFTPSRAERDIDDELSFHLAMQARAAREAGADEAEAIRCARLDLRGIRQTKERCRDTWPLRWADDLLRDIRYAVRGLRRAPAFTLAVVIVLALGLGANTALFSVVSAVLLRPLPYPSGNRLVRIWTAMPTKGYPRSGSSLPDYRVWRAANHSFEEMGASAFAAYNLTGADPVERLLATSVTASMWEVLKPQPLLGTLFSGEAEQWGRHRVAVISEGFWRRRFGADPFVVGRSLRLNGEPYTVVGVVPSSFRYPNNRTELWTPISFRNGDSMDTRGNHFVEVIARLKPETTLEQARADLGVIAAGIRERFPENAGLDVTILSWRDDIVGEVRPTLWLLFGSVALVLLIACTNVANLVLARSIARRQELTIRLAIGAGRARVARQLLTENLLLAAIGALLGLGLASLLVAALPALGPVGIPRLSEVTLDRSAILFAAGLAILTGVGFGLWPVRRAAHLDLVTDLKESAHTAAGGTDRNRGRRILVVAEVSLSLVLLTGAALLIASLVRLQRVDAGFRPDRVLTARLNLAGHRYQTAEQIALFVRSVTDRIALLPGVEAGAAGTGVPLGRIGWGKYFSIDGRPAPASLAQVPNVEYRQITPDYFRALGATLTRGRAFSPHDVAQQPAVAIVNATLARRFWPRGDPIGQGVSLQPPESLLAGEIAEAIAAGQLPRAFQRFPRLTIVGVVQDLREDGLDRPAKPAVYVPFAQAVPPHEDAAHAFFLVVRTRTDPLALRLGIEAAVHELDANLPVANAQTMTANIAESLARRRFAMLLLGGLAGVALVLVVAGMYGVMTYMVNQRRHEFGVRMAVGATGRDLTALVVSQGLRVTAAGVVAGVFCAAAFSRFLSGQLFEVKPLDPAIYAATTAVMAIVAILACAIPALRAARLDPASMLRRD